MGYDDWANYGFDTTSLTRDDEEGARTSATGWGHTPYFHNLHVARAEMEREFRRT